MQIPYVSIWPCCCQRRYNLRMSLAAMHLMANCRSSFSIWKCTWELPLRLLPNRRRYHAKSKDRYVVSFQRSALYFWGLRTIRSMRSIQNSFSVGGYPAPVPSSIRQFPCAVINRKYRHGTKHATLHMSLLSASHRPISTYESSGETNLGAGPAGTGVRPWLAGRFGLDILDL
ncbi:hypothetical protein BC629DRAFT_704624 [Irpex lacteus]|nr:hypothetical protein BC629DRAFT_704624 [Irpex lacteus]